MAEASLHSDTVEWLGVRNAYRNALAAAFQVAAGQSIDDLQQAADDAAAALADDPGNADLQAVNDAAQQNLQQAQAALECPAGGGCPDLSASFENWPPSLSEDIEQQSDENGWPNCEDLYEDNDATFKSQSRTMEENIAQQRQINTLESYRKMLLHKKQKRCELFASFGACLANESQSQSELEQLLLNKRVGTSGSGGDG